MSNGVDPATHSNENRSELATGSTPDVEGGAGVQSAGEPRDDRQSHLFSVASIHSPLDELKRVYEVKLRGLRSREDEELASQLGRAYEIARGKLLAALAMGHGRTSAAEPFGKID